MISQNVLQFKNGISIVLPLARDINKGSVYYFDAMYGSFGYDFRSILMVSSDYFLFLQEKFLKIPHIHPARLWGIYKFQSGTGTYKSYTFNQRFSAGFSYEF